MDVIVTSQREHQSGAPTAARRGPRSGLRRETVRFRQHTAQREQTACACVSPRYSDSKIIAGYASPFCGYIWSKTQ